MVIDRHTPLAYYTGDHKYVLLYGYKFRLQSAPRATVADRSDLVSVAGIDKDPDLQRAAEARVSG
jgi:hypothetical protein